MNIKKNSEVLVIKGKDKGKTGKIKKILNKNKVLVEGINKYKKNLKANPAKNIEADIVEIEMPISIANIALYRR